jgi:hypothetical protein
MVVVLVLVLVLVALVVDGDGGCGGGVVVVVAYELQGQNGHTSLSVKIWLSALNKQPDTLLASLPSANCIGFSEPS